MPVDNHQEMRGQLGEVLDLMRLLWGVDHRLQATSKRMATTLGVTGPQRLAIRLVGQFPDISAGRLAGLLCVHPSTLTGILQRLERRGILRRRRDHRDARRARFRLTAKGIALNRLRSGTVETAVRRALSKVTREEVSAAETVFRALHAELVPDR